MTLSEEGWRLVREMEEQSRARRAEAEREESVLEPTLRDEIFEVADRAANPNGYSDDPEERERRAVLRDLLAERIQDLVESVVGRPTPKLIVSITEEGVAGVHAEGFELPEGIVMIERDYTAGSTPDAHGDLYVDTEI